MINIAMDAGSGLAGKTISPIMNELNESLDVVFKGSICDDCEDISIVLRVSGEIHNFSFEGCEPPKFNKKEKSVQVDIGVPEEKWKPLNKSELISLVAKYLEQAIKQSYELLIEKQIIEKSYCFEKNLKQSLSAWL